MWPFTKKEAEPVLITIPRIPTFTTPPPFPKHVWENGWSVQTNDSDVKLNKLYHFNPDADAKEKAKFVVFPTLQSTYNEPINFTYRYFKVNAYVKEMTHSMWSYLPPDWKTAESIMYTQELTYDDFVNYGILNPFSCTMEDYATLQQNNDILALYQTKCRTALLECGLSELFISLYLHEYPAQLEDIYLTATKLSQENLSKDILIYVLLKLLPEGGTL